MNDTQRFYTQWQINLVGNKQRVGQACYNAAHTIFGVRVEVTNGTLFDPFEDDHAIPLFLTWLYSEGVMG